MISCKKTGNQNHHLYPDFMKTGNSNNKEISCFLIDDEYEAIDQLENLIEKIDCLTIKGKTTDPDEAIDLVIKLHPEIIFLDIVMPQMTGFEVIDKIRGNGIHPYFIFVTGYDSYSITAIKKQAFDYLLKPIDILELKETISRYLSKRVLNINTINFLNCSFKHLSTREKEIMEHLVEGKTSLEISKTTNISKNTVDTHRRNILEKTGLTTTNELIRYYFSIYG